MVLAMHESLSEQIARWYCIQQRPKAIEEAVVDVLKKLEHLELHEEEEPAVLEALESIRENVRDIRTDVREVRAEVQKHGAKIATLLEAVVGNGSPGLNDRVATIEKRDTAWQMMSTEFPKFVTEFRDLQGFEAQEHATQKAALNGLKGVVAIATVALGVLTIVLKLHG